MAAAHALDRQPGAPTRAVRGQRLAAVLRACRIEAAALDRTSGDQLVQRDQTIQDPGAPAHRSDPALVVSAADAASPSSRRSARWTRPLTAGRSSSHGRSATPGRQMTTRSTSGGSSSSRMIARARRLARLRTTAEGNPRVAAAVQRAGAPSTSGRRRARTVASSPRAEDPERRTARTSREGRRRMVVVIGAARQPRTVDAQRNGPRHVAGPRPADHGPGSLGPRDRASRAATASRRQALAPPLTTTLHHRTPLPGAHARTEAVAAVTTTVLGLVGALHRSCSCPRRTTLARWVGAARSWRVRRHSDRGGRPQPHRSTVRPRAAISNQPSRGLPRGASLGLPTRWGGPAGRSQGIPTWVTHDLGDPGGSRLTARPSADCPTGVLHAASGDAYSADLAHETSRPAGAHGAPWHDARAPVAGSAG